MAGLITIIEVILGISVFIIAGLIVVIVSMEADKPRQFKEERQRGYDEAVKDMIIRHSYWNREKDKYITVTVKEEE